MAKKKTTVKKPRKKTSVPSVGGEAPWGDGGAPHVKKEPEINVEEPNYRRIPPLAAYIDRIGAEERNFKRFLVTEKRGNYYVERALIKIEDGEIICSRAEFRPTKEEADAIRVALKSIEGSMPKSIGVRNIDSLREQFPNGTFFEFFDRNSGLITFVQERRRLKDGRKIYPPWSFWSDGKWRSMECEGGLPFWKPRKSRLNVNRIMVHEGGKAAEFMDAVVNDPDGRGKELLETYGHKIKSIDEHPWGEYLKQYEHWGIIGGALAPHRADYDELKREKPTETIYVCDNDNPGRDMLRPFSERYQRSLKGMQFDQRFPSTFDLADPMPEETQKEKLPLFKNGRWIGPSFHSLLKPATFATDQTPAGKGKPTLKLNKDWKEEWFHCVRPAVFVHRDYPDVIWTKDEFNNHIQPWSHTRDTALLVYSDDSSKSSVLKYNPGMASGLYGDEAGIYINTHRPSSIRAIAGNIKPFIEYLDHLIIDQDDRIEVERWIATLIARPDTKMLYGMLMISGNQGVGKSTLGEKILAPLVGEHNTSYPQESEIVESNYNYWSSHKRLAVVHEIYAGHSAKAYNRLKSIITDRYIEVSKKYQANYTIENWIHVYACSNSLRAIHLPNDDRRWFVPKVNEETKPQKYWAEFNRWLTEEGGLEAIKWWAIEWVKEHSPVLPGAAAPMSRLKKEIIEESMSAGQKIAGDLLDQVRRVLEGEEEDDQKKQAEWRSRGWLSDRGAFILDTALVELIKNEIYDGRHNDRLERPATLRKLAKAKGWFIGEHRATVKEWATLGGRSALGARLIATTAELAKAMPNTLCNEKMDVGLRLRPIDVAVVRGL